MLYFRACLEKAANLWVLLINFWVSEKNKDCQG
jgi:hypothetical protein